MGELLSLRKVRLHYWRGRRHVVRVLEEVSLGVGAGEVVCVWAQRGQGKTTLLRVAAGLERPGDGRVLFEGCDVWEMADEQRAQLLGGGIGWVERVAPEAVDAPVLRHVALPVLHAGGRGETDARALGALERVGASGCAEHVWGSLSELERARVALARGIVHEPRLLVADDLTTMLSAREADGVVELLASLARERSVGVLASVSDLSSTTWSDRVATLFGGELVVPPRASREGGGEVIEFPAG
jgi:predicted ABC-type transport system involved in lysophospholipase L1 biosynthesis ATPase subunit